MPQIKECRCRTCNRILKDPFYAKLGIGRICADNIGAVIPDKPSEPKKAKAGKKKQGRKIKKLRIASDKTVNRLQMKIPFTEFNFHLVVYGPETENPLCYGAEVD